MGREKIFAPVLCGNGGAAGAWGPGAARGRARARGRGPGAAGTFPQLLAAPPRVGQFVLEWGRGGAAAGGIQRLPTKPCLDFFFLGARKKPLRSLNPCTNSSDLRCPPVPSRPLPSQPRRCPPMDSVHGGTPQATWFNLSGLTSSQEGWRPHSSQASQIRFAGLPRWHAPTSATRSDFERRRNRIRNHKNKGTLTAAGDARHGATEKP